MNAPVGRTIVFSLDGTGNEPDDTYECIARAAHRGGRQASRTVGNLRMKLYELLRHRTVVPLHRIATKGDLDAKNDSEETRAENNRRRKKEGPPRDDSAWWEGR